MQRILAVITEQIMNLNSFSSSMKTITVVSLWVFSQTQSKPCPKNWEIFWKRALVNSDNLIIFKCGRRNILQKLQKWKQVFQQFWSCQYRSTMPSCIHCSILVPISSRTGSPDEWGFLLHPFGLKSEIPPAKPNRKQNWTGYGTWQTMQFAAILANEYPTL